MSTRKERMERIDQAVFRVITSADWQRELRRARASANAVSARIRSRLLIETKNGEGAKSAGGKTS
jgi:hypothetical protein